jgi:phosphoglycolate phosphatase
MEKPSNDFNETPEYLSFQLKKCIEEDYINQSNLPTYTISDVDNLFEDFNHELQVLKEFDFSDRLESEIEGDFENAFLALAEIKSFIGGGVKALLEKVMGEDHRPGVHVFRQYYWEHIADFSRPYPQVLELLDSLKQKDILLYVWTNKLEGLSRRLLSVLNMENYFEDVIGGDVARKPEIEALRKRFPKELPQSAWMIGDSVLDIQAGKNSGFKTAAFMNGFGVRENLVKAQPDFCFESFQELIDRTLF